MTVSGTSSTRHFAAPRSKVYAALIDGPSVQRWMVPDGMTSEVHAFEGREGGKFRISLTYEAKDRVGKSAAQTDTYHGQFVQLVPDELVVQVSEFETADPALRGEMRITLQLSDEAGGTRLRATHENLPPGVEPEDNELGWKLSLDKLARLVE